MVFVLALVLGVGTARAAVIVNFDALDTSGGPVSGPTLDAYLAGFGITLSNVSNTTPEAITTAQSGGFIFPTSSPNFFWGGSTSNASFSYRLNFDTPLDSFTFTRIGFSAVAAPWTASALDADNNVVAQVGEPFRGSSGPTVFTLNPSASISAVVFQRTVFNSFAGLNNPPTDNWVLTPVPEPTSLAIWGVGAVAVLFGARRRRNHLRESGLGGPSGTKVAERAP
jgi:hypothetical protein